MQPGGTEPARDALGGEIAPRCAGATAVHAGSRQRLHRRTQLRFAWRDDRRPRERGGGGEQEQDEEGQGDAPRDHPPILADRRRRAADRRRPAGAYATVTTRPAVILTSSAGVRRKTVFGWPAAAQTSSKASRCSSTSVRIGFTWPTGATPPIAKPVSARTKSASARSSVSPTRAATLASSTRWAPLVATRSARPESRSRKTSDLTIWSTRQPTARAASAAVRADSPRSTTSC